LVKHSQTESTCAQYSAALTPLDRTLRLTAAARTLVAHTETILAQLELAQADLDASEGRHEGELRLAAFPTAVTAVLAPALRGRPRVRVDELEPDEALGDFADASWIAPPARLTCAREVERTCAAAGFEPHVTSRVLGYDQVLALVAAGVGVALVPRLAAKPVDGVRYLEADAHRSVFAATRRGSASRPALMELREALLSSGRCSIAI
jgi:DNA-binding transcriptional LysR family regulator